MEAPTFDYSNVNPQGEPADTSGTDSAPRVVESASASTACQTNDSKFAYILTAGVLGLIALIALAITMLVFAIVGMGITSGVHYY